MKFEKYIRGLTVNKGVLTDEGIARTEIDTGFHLSEDYKDFLREVNGCEGVFGNKNYAILWKGEELAKYNKEYQVADLADGMLLFGSDGGGEAFAFDALNNMAIVRIPFVGMERDLAVPLAKSFSEYLNILCEKDLYE